MEVKGKLVNGVVSQYSYTTSERGVSSITTADAHTSAASSRLNWRPRRFKWTRPFQRKTKSGFCVCVITFQTQSTSDDDLFNTVEFVGWQRRFGRTCCLLFQGDGIPEDRDSTILPNVTVNLQTFPVRTTNTDMRRITTGIRSEKCVVRWFRRCANVVECNYTN